MREQIERGKVRDVCTLPDKVQYKSATGPSAVRVEGTEVVFEPLPRLAPKADAVSKVASTPTRRA